MPDRTRQSQAQDQPGGMNDGKIRNKLKKNRPNRKSKARSKWRRRLLEKQSGGAGYSRCRPLRFSFFLDFHKFQITNIFKHQISLYVNLEICVLVSSLYIYIYINRKEKQAMPFPPPLQSFH